MHLARIWNYDTCKYIILREIIVHILHLKKDCNLYGTHHIILHTRYHKHIQKHTSKSYLTDNFLFHMLIKRPLMNNVQNLSWLLYHNHRKGLTSNDLFISNVHFRFNVLQFLTLRKCEKAGEHAIFIKYKYMEISTK